MKFRTDTLLMLALIVSAGSPLLRHKYRPRWTSNKYPMQGFLKLRALAQMAFKNRARLGTRAKIPLHREVCRVETVVLKLAPHKRLANTCKSISVRTAGCRGRCTSYSQLDTRNVSYISHSCSCCKPIRHTLLYHKLPCKNGTPLQVTVKNATKCMCRPCSGNIVAKEIVKFRDLITKAAANTPLPRG